MQALLIDDMDLSAIPLGGHSPDVDGFQYVVKNTNTKILKIPENTPIIHGPIILWIATRCSFPGYQFVTGSGSITETSQKCLSNLSLGCYKKFASGRCTGTFTQTSPPYTVYTCNCNINIIDSGQDKIGIN